MASLLSRSNNRASMEYMNHMEESLASARTQLETFTQRCRQLEEAQQNMAAAACQVRDTTTTYLYTFIYFINFIHIGVCYVIH